MKGSPYRLSTTINDAFDLTIVYIGEESHRKVGKECKK